MLDPRAHAPLYLQLKETIKSRIAAGQYKANESIPSETALCSEFNVSRITVRNAVEELVRDGTLVKKQGKGTYVRSQKLSRKIHFVLGFTASLEQQGFAPSGVVLEKRILEADERVARLLEVPPRSAVLYLKRVRYADGHAVCLENNYFPLDRYRFLLEEDLSGSLYTLLEQRIGVRATGSRNNVLEVTVSDATMAKIMNGPIGDPYFYMTTVVTDQNDEPIYLGLQYFSGDFYTFGV